MSTVEQIRKNVQEHIKLISNSQLLRDYPLPSEWISQYVDDLYSPKDTLFLEAFTEDELKDLAEYYGRLMIAAKEIEKIESNKVEEILKIPAVRSLISFAKDLSTRIC